MGAKKSKEPKGPKGPRKTLRQFADGDFVILKIAQSAEEGPAGSLVPLQPQKHFLSTQKAMSWIRTGETGIGRFAIVKFCKILNVKPTQQVVCQIDETPKVPSAPSPEAEDLHQEPAQERAAS